MSNNITFGNFNKNFSYEIIAGKKRRIYTSERKAKYYYIYKNGKKVKRYLTKTQYHQLRRRKKGIKETKSNKRIGVKRRKETKSKKPKRIKIILSCHGSVLGDIIYPSDKLPIFTYITRTQIGYVDYFDYSLSGKQNAIYLYKRYLKDNIEFFDKKGNIYHINEKGKEYQDFLKNNMYSNQENNLTEESEFECPFKLLKIHSKNKEGIINNIFTFSENINGVYVIDENNKLTRYIINNDNKNIFLEKVVTYFRYTGFVKITLKKLLKYFKTYFDTKIQGNYELEIYSLACRTFECSESDKYKLLKKQKIYYEQISKSFNIKLDKFDSMERFFIFNKKWNELTKTQEKVFLKAYESTLQSYVNENKNIPDIFKIQSNNLNKNLKTYLKFSNLFNNYDMNYDKNYPIIFGNFNQNYLSLWKQFIECITGNYQCKTDYELDFVIKLLIHLVNNYNYLKFTIIPNDSSTNIKFSINIAKNIPNYLRLFKIKISGLVSDENIIYFITLYNQLILKEFIKVIIDS